MPLWLFIVLSFLLVPIWWAALTLSFVIGLAAPLALWASFKTKTPPFDDEEDR